MLRAYCERTRAAMGSRVPRYDEHPANETGVPRENLVFEPGASSMVTKIATMLLSPSQGSTLVKPPPTPIPTLLETPLVVAAPLPIEAAPLTELL